MWRGWLRFPAYLDDVQRLVDRSLGAEGEAGVDFGRHLAGDDGEDLLAELDQEPVQSRVYLVVDGSALLLGVLDGHIDQLGVLGLIGSLQDQGGVGRSILGLVFANGWRESSAPIIAHSD